MLNTKEQLISATKRKLDDDNASSVKVAQFKRRRTIRKGNPSQINPDNSEQFQNLKGRTSRRRRKETLDSCKVIHGDCEGSVL